MWYLVLNKINKKIFVTKNLLIFAFLFFGAIFLNSNILIAGAESISNVSIVPDLDISRFASYYFSADITGSPVSVSTVLTGINRDGGSDWNYYVNGTSVSDAVTKTMTDDNSDGTWITGNVYPDSIYPEIFFAPSSITWNNIPSNIDVRRASYHLFHLTNPFEMATSSTFFIEVNAVPRSLVNSADLEVYLVQKGQSVSLFNSDWRSNVNVELIGTINRSTVYSHNHVVGYSSHYLIPLTVKANGKIGIKDLDINDDFWIVLYANSPNTARGWDLKYHNSSLCTNTVSWYIGNQAGWTTIAQNGCPDSHVHIARRGTPSDGVQAITTATYADTSTVSTTTSFYFEPLPNLAPNQTEFISPSAGSTFATNTSITISWDPASDPNLGDNLTYNLYYYTESSTTTLATATTSTSFVWDISSVPVGSYGLKGETCDDADTPLCTAFYLNSNLNIVAVSSPVYSLSDFSIISNNASTTLAKAGDTITLNFTASGDISSTIDVKFYPGGATSINAVATSSLANAWTVTYVVSADDTDGTLDYVITADNLDLEYSSTTLIIINAVPPATVVASPSTGTYTSTQSINLTSTGADYIRFTTDSTAPTCSLGVLYNGILYASSQLNIKAIGCDYAGNNSSVATFQYNFPFSSGGSAGFIPSSSTNNSGGSIVISTTPTPTPTPTPTNTNNQLTLQEQIANLLEQVNQLQSQLSNNGGLTGCKFQTYLKYDNRGEEVKCLQEFLKNQGTEIYPEGIVSSWFGPLTKQAVIKFQEKYFEEILTPWGFQKGTGYVAQTTTAQIRKMLGL
jgi:hypothetical protein